MLRALKRTRRAPDQSSSGISRGRGPGSGISHHRQLIRFVTVLVIASCLLLAELYPRLISEVATRSHTSTPLAAAADFDPLPGPDSRARSSKSSSSPINETEGSNRSSGYNQKAHVFTYLSPTYEEMVSDFEDAEKRWKTAEGALPSTARDIATKYGLPETILAGGDGRCRGNGNGNGNTTTLGWVPCQRCDAFRAESGRISRYIFQTWETYELTPTLCAAASSWSLNNSEYDYFLFSDSARDALIGKEFGTRILDSYKCLKLGAAKADFWRLCIMYLFGGIYLDVDTKQVAGHPFRTWGFANRSVVTGRACQEVWWLETGCAHQFAMIYEPFHPVIRGAILRSLDNLAKRRAMSPYDVSFWAYHLSWATSPYNNSYMPGWKGGGMGGRLDAINDESKGEMNNQTGGHWSKKFGREHMWLPECLLHAPRQEVEMKAVPRACRDLDPLYTLLHKEACSDFCDHHYCMWRHKKYAGNLAQLKAKK